MSSSPFNPDRRIVLDTNVVFDWLLFRDPSCRPLATAIDCGQVVWVATPAMRDEFLHVLSRGVLDAWRPDRSALESAWERHCRLVAAPPADDVSLVVPRCSDPDDQKFIECAVATQAGWLLSKDRAVLKLARRLRLRGVRVSTPTGWQPPECLGDGVAPAVEARTGA